MPDTLTVLAFIMRSAGLFVLVLLYLYFRQSSGRLVRPVRQVIAAFAFMLLWVWVVSLGDMANWSPHGRQLSEYGTRWIWLPNMVIDVFLAQFLIRLYLRDLDDVA